jgi:hypothetical protein
MLYDAPLSPDRFTGRSDIVSAICERLRDAQFLSSSVIGGPKTGRTSLLRYLASNKCGNAVAPQKIVRVYYDATQLGQNGTEYHFWKGTFRELKGNAEAAPFATTIDVLVGKAENNTLDEFDLHDLCDLFAAQGKRIALLIDNLENLLNNNNFWIRSSFFHQVRTLGQRGERGMAFVVATMRPLVDYNPPQIQTSPYQSIFLSYPMGLLGKEELTQYVDGVLRERTMGEKTKIDEIVEIVYSASEGHPFYANYVLALCVEQQTAGKSINRAVIATALRDQNGPVVALARSMRKELWPMERKWLDSFLNKDAIEGGQLARLKQLKSYGLMPPGIGL